MRLLLLSSIALFLFASCREPEKPVIKKERFPDAAAYNDFIITQYDSLLYYQEAIAQAFENPDQRAVTRAIKEFRTRCAVFRDSVAALPDWRGDTSLRAAAVNLFRVYETEAAKQTALIGILYTPDVVDTAKVSDTLTDADTLDPNDLLIPRYEQMIRKLEKNENAALSRFLAEQAVFAEKNKVKLLPRRNYSSE